MAENSVDQIGSDFMPVVIRCADWLKPDPIHEGERILWSDGSVHSLPENEGEYVTVLRRIDCISVPGIERKP